MSIRKWYNTRRIAAGHYILEKNPSGYQEIDELLQNIHLMALAIQSREQELEESKETLEQEIDERKQIAMERETLIIELQDALTQIKTLKGLLPICASCKKIRDKEGCWLILEEYIQDHSEAQFSHGICPECAKQLYPEFCR